MQLLKRTFAAWPYLFIFVSLAGLLYLAVSGH
jgi:hypothetical protein